MFSNKKRTQSISNLSIVDLRAFILAI